MQATVQDTDGVLWIAKFPSKHDTVNSGAWEMVVHELAKMCGLNVPEARLETFSANGATFIVKRFDREGKRRIHFSCGPEPGLQKGPGRHGDTGRAL